MPTITMQKYKEMMEDNNAKPLDTGARNEAQINMTDKREKSATSTDSPFQD
jgi:hypothetical protein